MKNLKKALVLLLTVVMTLSTFSVLAFAAEELAPEASNTIEISIDFARFVSSLQYLWMGMLCIFAVIGVIVLVTLALNKFSEFNVKKNSRKRNKD